MHINWQILLVLLSATCLVNCDRENMDILLDETIEEVEPEITQYALDYVHFEANDYVNSAISDASECEFIDPTSGKVIDRYYLITNTDNHTFGEPDLLNEGEFYLLYDILDPSYNHANIVVEIEDTLTLACPIVLDFEFDPAPIDENRLIGHFEGEFFIFNNQGTAIESIGILSGSFHVPMVECQ